MKIEDIREPNVYHYSRKLRGVTISGAGAVARHVKSSAGSHNFKPGGISLLIT